MNTGVRGWSSESTGSLELELKASAGSLACVAAGTELQSIGLQSMYSCQGMISSALSPGVWIWSSVVRQCGGVKITNCIINSEPTKDSLKRRKGAALFP